MEDDGHGGTVVGDVINHGKAAIWNDKEHTYHYHYGLNQGELTHEAQIVREFLRKIAADRTISMKELRQDYVKFMTT
jgi:hypothetical protein